MDDCNSPAYLGKWVTILIVALLVAIGFVKLFGPNNTEEKEQYEVDIKLSETGILDSGDKPS